ncbi:MAG: c-type cytochrome [Taibaiella sp.]|nr:c-type cytochrome [Taibaiella sp.]
MNKKNILFIFSLFVFFFSSIQACKKDGNPDGYSGPTPYHLVIPTGLPPMAIPANNPLTVEGVALGRKLFYDPILSRDLKMSCASCHNQAFAFSDSTLQFSIGVDGVAGNRNAMNLFNLGYQKEFFWDGGVSTLEDQVIGPIINPVEMHETIPNAIQKLRSDPFYPALFKKAFLTDSITTPLLMKAIAQFERTMVSGNSKYDQYKRGEATLTLQEMKGLDLFEDGTKGDCTHCHVMGSTFSDFEYRNTGLDSIYTDVGRYRITFVGSDSGKFKTPSLRNIALTAPYMHDGRFSTLQQCLDHYNTGFHYSDNLDITLKVTRKGRMNAQDMSDIIAFLHTLTDTGFIKNPLFRNPS